MSPGEGDMTKQDLVLQIQTCSSNELQLKSIELADPVSNWLIPLLKILKKIQIIPQ